MFLIKKKTPQLSIMMLKAHQILNKCQAQVLESVSALGGSQNPLGPWPLPLCGVVP
jgi:hypothetical protein